jgi:NAD(P)-dependent dehydrogenase (short-subunit alcohol dehydrogenase family)
MSDAVLVIGAQSEIGQSLIAKVIAEEKTSQVIAISRSDCPNSLASRVLDKARLAWMRCDYSDEQMKDVVERCGALLAEKNATLSRLIICNGRLHDSTISPEKRIEDLDRDTLHAIFESNAVIPALWLKHFKVLLKTHLKGRIPAVIAVLSARIGSIEDNGKGGWYAYRASKAALNMLLKTSAIEYQRSLPELRFIAFHPGTTDTPLSKPFQRSVPEGKLFTPDFVAASLLARLSEALAESRTSASFVAWDGSQIPW